MKTAGVFFLRARPYRAALRTKHEGEVQGWMLQLGERTDGGGVDTITATWRGQAADLFILQHDLSAGTCLQLEIERLRAYENELRGRVVRCSLAPPRWPRDVNGIDAAPSPLPSSNEAAAAAA